MKKTLFITMLAAALMGGQVFAADVIPTKLDGAVNTGSNTWSGTKETTEGAVAKDAKVTISEDSSGSDYSKITVYGGWSTDGSTTGNTVTMTGGNVTSVCAGKGATTVTGNAFIMEGGIVKSAVYGGSGNDYEVSGNSFIMTGGTLNSGAYGGRASGGTAQNNVAIVAGSSIINGNLYGGYSSEGDAKNNKVYLVGTGATATINGKEYTGGALTLEKNVSGGEATGDGATSSGNSIDIYGTGIKVGGYIQNEQILNFNITQSQLTGDYKDISMVTLTNRYLKLEDVTIGINDVDVQEWTPGTSVTLVQLENTSREITGIDDGTEVGIKRDGEVVATGKLVLSNDNRTLSLTIAQSTPEPTTGTLGLLALAGLAARRRKK